ncbi:MAG: hypothetical protein ACI4XR_00535 [Bacilli bacterium]
MKILDFIIPVIIILIIIFLLYKSNDVIKYNVIKVPKNKKYLKGIYLKGIDVKVPSNLLFTVDNNIINLAIEEKTRVLNQKIKFSEIQKIDFEIEPYHFIKDKLIDDFVTDASDSLRHENYDTIKRIKVIKSYHVILSLKNGVSHEFICFKDPNNFFKEENV